MAADDTGPQGAPARGDPRPDAQPDEETLARTVGDARTVREVFDQMPVMMVGIEGPGRRFDAANTAYRAFFARPGLVGMSVREAFPEVVGQQVYELVDRVYTTEEPQTGRGWRFQVDRTGTGAPQDFYADFTVAPRRSADGTVTGLVVSVSDVTDRVQERHALLASEAEAERRYEAARDVVAELQQALLPTALPALPRTRIAGRYLVAAEDQAAGGDWFDAVPLSDGSVALIVGDVVGHGVAASAAMGQLRAVLTELLASEPDLATVLGRVDAFASRDPALRSATLALAVLDSATGALRYSLAGHPPPLVVGADGTTRYLPDTGSGPLGTGSPPSMESETLAPGELVLLYSDGLIERPKRTLDDGKAELAQVAADAMTRRAMPAGAAATPCERVCQLTIELLTRTGYTDDVTTLAAQRLPTPVPIFEHELRSHPASLGELRRDFDSWLDEVDPLASDRDALELAVWEAVTNAIEHAYPADRPGAVWLRAELQADGDVECEITDHGTWHEPDLRPDHRGRGLLLADQLVDRLTVSHHGQQGPTPDGESGTVVRLHHRLSRPAMTAAEANASPPTRQQRPPYRVEVDTSGDASRVRVSGPVDIATADDLERELLAACRGGVLGLTVDLTEVTHLGSAGVRALHEVLDQLSAHGHRLSLLAPPSSPAAAVLDLVQLPREDAGPGPAETAGNAAAGNQEPAEPAAPPA